MLDRPSRVAALLLRLRRFNLYLSNVAFFIGWLGVVLVAARHWHTTSTIAHLCAITLLWVSLVMWVGLLRGKSPASTAISGLGAILMTAAMLWSECLH